MNDFFTSLLDRHLGTCDTIQPRTLGRFEVDRSGGVLVPPDEGINPITSDVEVPKVTVHEPDQMESNNDDSSSSHLELSNPSVQPGLTELQDALSDSLALPRRPYETHPFDEVQYDSQPPNSHCAEYNLESELKHRIRAMQRLMDDSKSPVIEPVAVSLNSVLSTSEHLINSHNNVSNDGGEDTATLYDPLEPPSWLTEIEAKFNLHSKDKEAKTEPVINVTIGRVEVRAVQAEAPKKARQSKKTGGVMPLDEYLKKREGRETK